MPSAIRSRRYVFTVNNPEGEIDTSNDSIRYCVYQLEQGKEGTKHYQGYVEFKKQMTLAGVKKLGGHWENMHLEIAKGSQEQCIKYCTKEDTRLEEPIEYGEKAKEGAPKRKLEDVAKDILDGASIKQVALQDKEHFIRHHKGIIAFKNITSKERCWKTKGWVFYGDTGCGKSYTAKSMFPNAFHVPDNDINKLWFDGYDGQETIVFNDFNCKMSITFLLNLIDEYPQQLPIKGGHVQNLAKNVIFTSNIDYDQWYKNYFEKVSQHKKAFDRRMEEIWEFRGTSYKDVKIIKHRTESSSSSSSSEAGQPSQGPRSSVARGPEETNENSEMVSSEEQWNVGGGAECYYCNQDIRHCKNKCKINIKQQTSPTSLSILKSMREQEWKWMVNATKRYEIEYGFECNEDFDEIQRVIDVMRHMDNSPNKCKYFWGHTEHTDAANPYLGKLNRDEPTNSFVL